MLLASFYLSIWISNHFMQKGLESFIIDYNQDISYGKISAQLAYPYLIIIEIFLFDGTIDT